MTTWTGYYIEATGVSDFHEMANTTTTGGFTIVGPLDGDDGGDSRLYPNSGDTIDGQEVVGLVSLGAWENRVLTIDGVDHVSDLGLLGFVLADGRLLISPNFGSGTNQAIIDALNAGGTVESITLSDVTASSWNGVPEYYVLPDYTPVCFARGTLIETPAGPVPVERLAEGSLVLTLDGPPAPVCQVTRWIGPGSGRRGPVRIAPGALGPGQPARALTLSPQHRLLVVSPIAERMFGTPEVLIPARLLVGLPGITRPDLPGPVSYVHFACAAHQIVRAEGSWAETLLPGPETCRAMAARGLPAPRPLSGPARPIPTARRARRLLARHGANRTPLVAVEPGAAAPSPRPGQAAACTPPAPGLKAGA